MATDLRTRLVLDARDKAVATRKPAVVVHQSDQVSQAIHVAGVRDTVPEGRRPSIHRFGRRRL